MKRQSDESVERVKDLVANLQWKYDHLDEMFARQSMVDEVASQIKNFEQQLNDLKQS